MFTKILYTFLIGGGICLIGQLLIDLTKLTPARILVGVVSLGVLLGALGLYEPLFDFCGVFCQSSACVGYDGLAEQSSGAGPCSVQCQHVPEFLRLVDIMVTYHIEHFLVAGCVAEKSSFGVI